MQAIGRFPGLTLAGDASTVNASYALWSKSTNLTSFTNVSLARTVARAMRAASSSGQRYTPVEIAGNATVAAPSSSAIRSEL